MYSRCEHDSPSHAWVGNEEGTLCCSEEETSPGRKDLRVMKRPALTVYDLGNYVNLGCLLYLYTFSSVDDGRSITSHVEVKSKVGKVGATKPTIRPEAGTPAT